MSHLAGFRISHEWILKGLVFRCERKTVNLQYVSLNYRTTPFSILVFAKKVNFRETNFAVQQEPENN